MKQKNLLYVLVALSLVHADLYIDSKMGMVQSEKNPGDNTLNRLTGLVEHRLWWRVPLGENGYIRLNHLVDGGLPDAALLERTVPLMHGLSTEIGGRHAINWRVGVANYANLFSDTLVVPWYEEGTRFRSKMLTEGKTGIGKEWERFEFDLGINYFRHNLDFTQLDSSLTKSIDDNLWSTGTVAVSLFEQFELTGFTRYKSDLNSNRSYDYGDFRFGIGGDHEFRIGKSKLAFDWDLYERAELSHALYLREQNEGFTTNVQLLPMWKLSRGLYLTGKSYLSVGQNGYAKQRYRMALRKSWKNLNRVTLACQADAGTYIPRMNSELRATVHAGPVVITPSAVLFWMNRSNESFRFYRNDMEMEIALKLYNNLQIAGSCNYSNYEERQPYTDRLSFYLGVKR